MRTLLRYAVEVVEVVEVVPIGERMMVLRRKHPFGSMCPIAVYVPTNISKPNVKEMSSGKIDIVADRCPR